MENLRDAINEPTLGRLFMYLYLVPIFGLVPAAWTISQSKSDRQHRAVSRLAIALGLAWIAGSGVLNLAGAPSGEPTVNPQIAALLFNSLLTSGYFVTSFWLMFRLWKRQTLSLPVLTQIAKYLP